MDNCIFFMCGALGDEINLFRNCLLDLLHKKHITKDVVIYCESGRKFLYENIFHNILLHEECPREKTSEMAFKMLNKECIFIDFFNFFLWPGRAWEIYGGYEKFCTLNFYVTTNNIFGYKKINYYNDSNRNQEFKNLVTNINYLPILPAFNDKKYIAYHHRFKNEGSWDQPDDKLNKILRLQNKFNIVITSYKDLSHITNDKVYYTKNLKEFASFIHSDNCLALISVWSGGGILGSYCNNSKILMYFDKCQSQYNQFITQGNVDNYIKSENGYDFCHFTDADRKFIKEEDLEYHISCL